jgi:hypothetical protein
VVGAVLSIVFACLTVNFLRRRKRGLDQARLYPKDGLNNTQASHCVSPFVFTKEDFFSPEAQINSSPSSLRPPMTPESLAERRLVRQRDLTRQMEIIQREIEALQEEAAEVPASARLDNGSRENSDLNVMDQLRRSQAHIAYLQLQLHSSWAMGLSDDPLPPYEARSRGRDS